MKAIFLDIDGVLNTFVSLRQEHKHPTPKRFTLDVVCVRNLQRILEATPAKVVLSSSWRCTDILFMDLHAELAKHGIDIWEKTPDIRFRLRGEEIAVFLKEHPEIERFVILDDDSDMLPEQLPFFVQTSMDGGLQDFHAQKAIEILLDNRP